MFKILGLLVFLAAIPAVPGAAYGEDSRLEAARRLRDELIQKKRTETAARGPARGPAVVDPWEEAVSRSRERLAALDGELALRRNRAGEMAGPREQLLARQQDLAAAAAQVEAANAKRVEAMCRAARLGAGAAGWHADPARSARLSRYLAAVASAQQQALDKVEVERGSVVASLDGMKTAAAVLDAEVRLLETEKIEAQAALDRALADQASRPDVPLTALVPEVAGEEEAEGSEDAAGEAYLDAVVARSAAARGQDGAQGEAEDEAAADADGINVPGAADDGAAPAEGEDDADEAPLELEEGPAVLAPEPEPEPEPEPRGLLARLFGDPGEAEAFAASRGKLPPPVVGKVVANYGQQHKSGATYRGVILRASHSAPVRAVAPGRVSFAGVVPGLGNTVIVTHGDRYHTVYARLGPVVVKEGDRVAAGALVGGLPADNSDMHFELRDRGAAIDPLPWLRDGIPGAPPVP